MQPGAASVGGSRRSWILAICAWCALALWIVWLYTAETRYRRNYLDHMAAIGSIPVYTPGDTVEWTDNGKVLLVGWSIAEAEFRWSMGKSVGFAFRLLSPPSAGLHLDMHVGPTVGAQRVAFTANDEALGSTVVSGPTRIELPVPSAVLRPGVNVIRIALPDARRANDLDPRILGISLIRWRLTYDPVGPSTVVATPAPAGAQSR
jgi:hypothetical protein